MVMYATSKSEPERLHEVAVRETWLGGERVYAGAAA